MHASYLEFGADVNRVTPRSGLSTGATQRELKALIL
jgi:hypothetical protein